MKNYLDYSKYLINKFPSVAVVILTVVIIILGTVGYFYYQNKKSQSQNPQVNTQQEVQKLVAEVGKLIDLPSAENPTIATVTDIEKLKGQPFFQKAKNGDKVLIYSLAKKAILYDPLLKKVLDVAPINVGSPSASLQPSPSPKKSTLIKKQSSASAEEATPTPLP